VKDRPVLLIVHGRSVHPADGGAEVRREWSSALSRGLAAAGIDSLLIPETDRRLVYYGDVYGKGYEHPHCRDVTRLVATLPATESEAANPANGSLRLAKSFSHFMPSSWRYTLIMPFTKDTKEYIERGAQSCSVRNIYRDSIEAQGSRPIVVLAHSQGALLTYEYQAHDEGWADSLSGFVSFGVQFGFDALMTRFGAKAQRGGNGISTPPGLGHVWYNFYDSQDPVAFSMGGRYRPVDASHILREFQVRNPAEFRHTATGYLGHRTLALATADAWCRAFRSAPPGECAVVRDSIEHGNLESEPKHPPDVWTVLSVPAAVAPLVGYAWIVRRLVFRR
jgi:hypothetical protein